ncbi:MAG: protein kinase, partial [Myxococcales bacterium]|nr:protein kinase [Myxococcales bacterium]
MRRSPGFSCLPLLCVISTLAVGCSDDGGSNDEIGTEGTDDSVATFTGTDDTTSTTESSTDTDTSTDTGTD